MARSRLDIPGRAPRVRDVGEPGKDASFNQSFDGA
jgi:hypothetical protein